MQKAKIAKTKLAPKALLVSLVVLIGLAFGAQISSNACKEYYQDNGSIDVGNSRKFSIEIADSQQARTKGLSGRNCIPKDTGMLFVFDMPARHGIWMKDMRFPIDILWLDKGKKVIDIKQNVLPDTYTEVFYPSAVAQYVLEVSSGSVDEYSMGIGQQLNW